METEQYFQLATIPLYCVGFLTFLCTILDDWLNHDKKMKRFAFYVQDFIYTFISIALGISICIAFETSQSISWIVSIIMGLCGSSIIRQIRNKREDIGQSVVDKIKDTIKNPGRKSSSNYESDYDYHNENYNYDDDILDVERGDTKYQSYNDICDDYNDKIISSNDIQEDADKRMRDKFKNINKGK